MYFYASVFAATAALATMVSAANSVHFINQDSTLRTIYFTPNEGKESIDPLVIPGSATQSQNFPDMWIGNWYSVSDGAATVPGMLGEVSFDSWGGNTYFDVSAIVNPDDHDGVKELFPLNSNTPMSGCQSFPCANAYNKWDDVATQATDSTELVCLLGTLSGSKKRSMASRLPREYIEGIIA